MLALVVGLVQQAASKRDQAATVAIGTQAWMEAQAPRRPKPVNVTTHSSTDTNNITNISSCTVVATLRARC